MKNYLLPPTFAFVFLVNTSCTNHNIKKVVTLPAERLVMEKKSSEKIIATNTEKNNDLSVFLPKGYKIYDTAYGDLNKDGLEDCIITIKGTDKKK